MPRGAYIKEADSKWSFPVLFRLSCLSTTQIPQPFDAGSHLMAWSHTTIIQFLKLVEQLLSHVTSTRSVHEMVPILQSLVSSQIIVKEDPLRSQGTLLKSSLNPPLN